MIAIGDQYLTVVQAGANGYGSVILTPTSAQAPASGVAGAIVVASNAPGFTWFATSKSNWISVLSGSPGTGNGQVTYQLQPNPLVNARQGSVIVGNQSFSVTQAGNGGIVALNPSNVSIGGQGGPGTVSVTASSSDFLWSVATNDYWVSFDYPLSHTGSTQLKYYLQQNTSQTPRVGTISIGDKTFTVTQEGAPVGLQFVPVTPCRILDTRLPQGPFGGPFLPGGTQRDFVVPQSSCSIPTTAQAYSVNVTVVPRKPLSYLTIWPSGRALPFVSTLNSFDGRVVANAAIVPAGLGGAVSIFVTDDTDAIVDINGYFAPGSTTATLFFYTVTPCRIADTRLGSGAFGRPALAAGAIRDFAIPSSGCKIPASAAAYSVNMTSVSSGPLSYLTTWPTGQPQPFVSTLNAPSGGIVANAAIVPAGKNGSISVFVTDKSDLVIDINGYFGPAGFNGMQFYALAPCRVMDTRLATAPLGGPYLSPSVMRTVPVSDSACLAPAFSKAFSLNATVVPSGPLAYLTLWPAGQTLPLASTLNAPTGGVVANAAIVPASNGWVNAFATNQTDLVLDINGYFAF